MKTDSEIAWTVTTANNPWETAILNGAVQAAVRMNRQKDNDSLVNTIDRYVPIRRQKR